MEPAVIVLVQDDRVDSTLFLDRLSEQGLLNEVILLSDGEAAAAYLVGEEPFVDAPGPDLILLALRLPRRSGYDIFRLIQEHATLAEVPVAVFGSQELEGEILNRLGLVADAFIPHQSVLDDILRLLPRMAGLEMVVVRERHDESGRR